MKEMHAEARDALAHWTLVLPHCRRAVGMRRRHALPKHGLAWLRIASGPTTIHSCLSKLAKKLSGRAA